MSMAAKRAHRNLDQVARNVLPAAVHVEIHPRPRNLAESREIMHVLQGYGELSMYKHLKVRDDFTPPVNPFRQLAKRAPMPKISH